MASNIIQFKNIQTGKIRRAPIGFSWTVAFWGGLVMLIRRDWMMFCVFLFTALVAEIVFAIGTGVSWESFEDYAGMPPGLVLIHSIVWAKFYNDLYVKGLIERDFKAFEVEKLKLEDVVSTLGKGGLFFDYKVPIMTESDNSPDKNEALKEAIAELKKNQTTKES